MTQLSIFDAVSIGYAPPMARASDPITSHEAAAQAKELQARHHRLILAALEQHGASGKDRLAAITGMSGVQIARRLPELLKAGRVRLTGREVRSDSGRNEREWRLA